MQPQALALSSVAPFLITTIACPENALPQEAEEAEEARQAEEEARQAAIVEAERQRLLRQAAAQLPRDCLPKGVFKVGGGGRRQIVLCQEYTSSVYMSGGPA